MNVKEVKLRIGGMTCINCKKKIEKELINLIGVISVDVDYRTGVAQIRYNTDKLNFEQIRSTIEKIGYEVRSSNIVSKNEILRTAEIVAIILMTYAVVQHLGLLNYLAPSELADSGMSYGMLFVVGLLTSVHCVAMCGGINLSQSLNAKDKKSFSSAIAYNLGRVISYTIIGFVMGGIGYLIGVGAQIGISVAAQGILKGIAGIFTVIMALNMLDIFPWFKKISITVPKPIASFIVRKRMATKIPFFVGFLNGFMPCGPLQSMWIVALSSANPFVGAISMLSFALGTLPLMLGLGSIVSWLGKKYTKVMMKAGGIVVAVLGLALISQGLSLSGAVVSIPVDQSSEIKADVSSGEEIAFSTSDETSEDVQLIESTLEWGAYPNISVKANVPVRWTINVPEGMLTGCNSRMIIPEYGIQYAFNYGENVIEFIPTEEGNFTYTCWMGMITGNIEVL